MAWLKAAFSVSVFFCCCCSVLRDFEKEATLGGGGEIRKKEEEKKEKEETEDLKTVPSTLFDGSCTTTYMHDLQGK